MDEHEFIYPISSVIQELRIDDEYINQEIDKKIMTATRFSPVFVNSIVSKNKDEKKEDK
jgi:hypothetical protein